KKDEMANAGVSELVERLGIPGLKLTDNYKIECYDISNIQGTNATSAMVVSVNGKLCKDLYRKFKIKTKTTPDDFAMLQEVLERRLAHLVDVKESNSSEVDVSFAEPPNLLVIDGGKGQL